MTTTKPVATQFQPGASANPAKMFPPGRTANAGGLTKERAAQLAVIRAAAVAESAAMLAELVDMAMAWREDPKMAAASKGAAETVLAYAVGRPAATVEVHDEGGNIFARFAAILVDGKKDDDET